MTNFEPTAAANHGETLDARSPWVSMEIRMVGKVQDVVQQGGGKLPTMPSDPGEPRKVPPSG